MKTLKMKPLCSQLEESVPREFGLVEGLPGKFRVPLSADGGLGGFLFVACGQSTHCLGVDGFHWWPNADDET
jgi:hypothetical protein